MKAPETRLSRSRRLACILLALAAAASAREAFAAGLSANDSRLIFETNANPLHPPAVGDELGYAVATGDFDGDGYDDLAIGLRSDDEPIFALADVGQVQIRFGGPAGLDTLAVAKYLWQGGSASVNAPEAGDHFGESLAVGDFDNDGFDDLAIGIPGEDINATANAGAIEVRYGAANRSQALETRRSFFEENTPDIPDTAGAGDEFGHSLAAGDFNGDGFDDLAIGVPFESVNGFAHSGRVFVLRGTLIGIAVPGAQTFDTDSPNVAFAPATNEYFGTALAAGDFDHDGFCDLAVGAPGLSLNRGIVFVLPGSHSGTAGSFNYYLLQGAFGLADSGESGDNFGSALAVGNFNGDAFADLAIGVPGESMTNGGPELAAAGAVHVQFGSAAGIVGAGTAFGGGQFWTPLSTGVPGEPEAGDRFGWRLAAGDFDGDGFDELAIGVPFEQNFRGPEEGDVVVLPGSASGPVGAGAVAWNLEVPGILGDMNPGDHLGWSLAVGDFDKSGARDLVIGIPNDGNIGGALVLYGSAAGTPGTLRFSLAAYTVTENVGTATVAVQRAAGADGPIGVHYGTAAGTATAGQDFVSAAGTLSWTDGDASAKTFAVTIANDAVVEPSETILLALTSPTGGATLDDALKTATLTIADDDAPPATPAAPSNLTAVGISSSKVRLTWNDNSSNELGFRIEARKLTGSYAEVATPAVNATTTVVEGLDAGTFYSFRARAVGSAGDSGYSNEAGATTSGNTASCVAGPERLCLNNARFAVEVSWRTQDGTTGRGKAVPVPSAPDSGLLYFFGPGNIELLVKVLNACVPSLGNRYWVFFAATTNVEFTLVVTDSHTGVAKSYFNALNHPALPVQDVSAFATCP